LTIGDGGFNKDELWGTTSPQLIIGDEGFDKDGVWEITSPRLTRVDGGGGGKMWWSGGSLMFTSKDKGVNGIFLPATTRKKQNAKRQLMIFTFISAKINFLE